MTSPICSMRHVFAAGAALAALLVLPCSSTAADSSVSAGSDAAARPVTFAKDIAPIFQARCQECHRTGSMAPMSLVTYEETRPWAKSIRQRVITRQMPPWHIDKTVGVQKFKNDISLTDEQIAHHRPLGGLRRAAWAIPRTCRRPSSGPPPNEWKAAKELGQPDLVIKSDALHHGGASSGCLVAADLGHPAHRAALGARRRNPSGHRCRAAGSRITPSPIWCRTIPKAPRRAQATRLGWTRAYLDGMGHRQGLRPVPPRYRQAACCPARKISWDVHIHAVGEEIRDNVELGIWFYPERPGAEVPHLSDRVSSRARLRVFQQLAGAVRPQSRYSAEFACRHRQLHRAEARRGHREFPAAHASARQGHAGGSHPAGRHRPN